jgi:putative transposase
MSDQTEKLPVRKRPAHGVLFKEGEPTIIFLTLCTKDRVPWLATPQHHAWLREVWTEATAWYTGRYVVMPDHIHLFAAPGNPELPFENWVKYWKSQFKKKHDNPAHRLQVNHWDTRLRREESYDAKWHYVVNNPVRHGLVPKAEDWPYQGEIFELPW